MATDKDISIGSAGGYIEWSATSDPTPPTIAITGGGDWCTASGNQVNVTANGGSQRTATISVTASTPPNDDYNGTASVTSAYTLTQTAGVSDKRNVVITPNTNWVLNNESNINYWALEARLSFSFSDSSGNVGITVLQSNNTLSVGDYETLDVVGSLTITGLTKEAVEVTIYVQATCDMMRPRLILNGQQFVADRGADSHYASFKINIPKDVTTYTVQGLNIYIVDDKG